MVNLLNRVLYGIECSREIQQLLLRSTESTCSSGSSKWTSCSEVLYAAVDWQPASYGDYFYRAITTKVRLLLLPFTLRWFAFISCYLLKSHYFICSRVFAALFSLFSLPYS